MIEHLAVAIVSAIAFLGAILLYGAFSPRRFEGWKFWLCFAAYCVLMEGNGFLANELFSVCGAVGDGVGRQTLYNVIRYALLYALLFRERPVIYLSVTVIFYSRACCIENLVVGAILIFQDDAIRLAVEYHERGWLIWINELLILCGCAIISKAHPYQPQSHGSQNRFTIPAIISLVSIVMTGRLQNGYYQGEINGAFLLYFAAVLLFSDVMTFVLIVWNEKDERLKGENLTLTARARTQAESIEALSASYTAQRKLTHDFNAHLATLSSYLENRQIKDAQDYIATLREHQTDRILIANTHNSTIDALLNQKAQVAKKNNIDIRFKVNDLSGTKVAPMDLVIIIGNLLDNAIEACLKLPAGEREIYAQLLLEGTLFLSFRNTSPPVEIVNGYIATTKKPPDLHGFGLQNVKTALKKYDSFYDMAYEDGYFAFTIEMENDLPSATKNSFFAT